MAWSMLPTNYTDAVWSGLKRYSMVNNEDGTVSFQDVTVYSNKENSFFGARDANRMNEAFAVMALSTLFALPIAIGSAIYAVEIKPEFGRRVFQPMVELLVGIPSVVFGLIGFHVVVAFMKIAFDTATGLGILPGAIVLAVMILPTITTFSIDALRSVPDSYRQGSLALGCTRWQTIWHVVLHAAKPSLITATILGMTRAFGETLAVRMVIGGIELMPSGLLDAASTITTTLTTSMAVYADGSPQSDILWSLGLLLMGMSLVFILLIHFVGRKGARERG